MKGSGIVTLNGAMCIADGQWVSALFCRRWLVVTDAMVGLIMGVTFRSAEKWSLVGLYEDAAENDRPVVAEIAVIVPGCRVHAFARATSTPTSVPDVGTR